MNISVYSPLIGSTYIESPDKLKNPMKGLINIKNNDNKCFLWCHIKHRNPLKINPERIMKADKNIINDFDYEEIKLPVSEKDIAKIERQNNICINVFCYENNLNYPVYVSDQKSGCNSIKNCMDLLQISNENKPYYVISKILETYVQKNINKKK